jgi:hypothetical protein
VNRPLAFLLSCCLLIGGVSVAEAATRQAKPIVIPGDRGPNVLTGGPRREIILGGPGNDRITGGKGRDTLNGGPGNDRFYAKDGEVDTIYCGTGPRDVIVTRDNSRRVRDIISSDCYDGK